MRISTFTILLTAALAGLGVAHPGEEPFHQVRRSTPDHIPRPFPPSPGPPPDRPLPPVPRPRPDSVARPRYHKRDPLEQFKLAVRSTPDHAPRPRPPPRPLPPSPGPPPDRPLPPLPRPLPDSLARPRNHKRQPDHEFEIHARQLEADLKALYAREAMENFDLYERDLADDFGLYERDIGTEDFELYERDLGGEDLELYERDLGEDYIDLE
jgi:hypothetical protein